MMALNDLIAAKAAMERSKDATTALALRAIATKRNQLS